MNNATELIESKIEVPSNKSSSRIVATRETKIRNNVQNQYSDRLDLVLKSKYLRNPEAIA
jgi:hypothetical protein|tara:strand:- start:371 stop:550 length:180 start_codon:yes stop_codon:yes gene_type:complete